MNVDEMRLELEAFARKYTVDDWHELAGVLAERGDSEDGPDTKMGDIARAAIRCEAECAYHLGHLSMFTEAIIEAN